MRIAFCGQSGAGKTELFDELKTELDDYKFYPEIARQLIDDEPALFEDKRAFERRLIEIYKLREHTNNPADNVVFDRCIFDCFVYSEYYGLPVDNRSMVKETLKSNIDIIFIIAPYSEYHKPNRMLNRIYAEKANILIHSGQWINWIEFDNIDTRKDFVSTAVNSCKPVSICGL
jgi:predicted ATPase